MIQTEERNVKVLSSMMVDLGAWVPELADKAAQKELTKLEAKKAAADQKAAEAAKKSEAEAVLKKLLASGVSADEILEKLK